MSIAVRQLRPEDDRAGFRSGNIDLDRFFQKFAGQNQFRHHIGTTYVAVDGDAVIGFATVSPSAIDAGRVPAMRRKRLPKYPMPVLRLARLAVDERAQGRGVGRVLLKAVFRLAKNPAAAAAAVQDGMPVVLASRATAGRVVTTPSKEKQGFMVCDNLLPQKARILLMLGLTTTNDPAKLQQMFYEY